MIAASRVLRSRGNAAFGDPQGSEQVRLDLPLCLGYEFVAPGRSALVDPSRGAGGGFGALDGAPFLASKGICCNSRDVA